MAAAPVAGRAVAPRHRPSSSSASSPTTSGTTPPVSTGPVGAPTDSTPLLTTLSTPVRVLDSRNGTGTPRGLKRDDVVLDLASLVPAGATSVVLNATVTNPTADGHLVVSPAGAPVPPTSNVNFRRDSTQANEVVVRVPADRKVLLHLSGASAHEVVDLLGWTSPQRSADNGVVTTLSSPQRLADSRSTSTRSVRGELPVALGSAVPADATAVVLNVTLAGATSRGFAVVHPTGAARPATSNVNVEAGQTQANEVLVRTGRDRSVSVFVDSTSAAVVVDLIGYVTPGGTGTTIAPLTTPQRLVDTRTGQGLSAGRKAGEQRLTLPSSVPAGARAVVLNVTAVGADRAGFVTAYAGGTSRPGTSNVNFGRSTVQANEVIVPVGADRTVSLFVGGAGGPQTHLVVDLVASLQTV